MSKFLCKLGFIGFLSETLVLSNAAYVSELYFENKMKEDVEVVAKWEQNKNSGWEKYTKVKPGEAVKFKNVNYRKNVSYKNLDVYTSNTKHHMSADIKDGDPHLNIPGGFIQVWEAERPGTTFRLREVHRDAPTQVGNSTYESGFLGPNFVHRVIVKNKSGFTVAIKVDYTTKDGKAGWEQWRPIHEGQAIAFKKSVKSSAIKTSGVDYNKLTVEIENSPNGDSDGNIEVIELKPQRNFYGLQEQYITIENDRNAFGAFASLNVHPVDKKGRCYNNNCPEKMSILDNATYEDSEGNIKNPPPHRNWFIRWWRWVFRMKD